MGKIILCSGEIAKNPYVHSETETSIYTMEELCYYIYNNIDIIDSNFLTEELSLWIEEETKMIKRGKRLYELINGQSNIKDIIVYILCSTDYYTEREIKELIYHMDDYGLLSPYEKKKKEAESHMKYKKYNRALILFEELLEFSSKEEMEEIELANIYHNMGVCKANIYGIADSKDSFKSAYKLSKREESLTLYLSALLLNKNNNEFNQVVLDNRISEDMVQRVKDQCKLDTYPLDDWYDSNYKNLKSKLNQDSNEFSEAAYIVVKELKENYRRMNQL